jgi:hypothetical protein
VQQELVQQVLVRQQLEQWQPQLHQKDWMCRMKFLFLRRFLPN